MSKIQIVVIEDQPILNIISGFYTTAVMNVISWNKAYSLFAWDTFLDSKTYLLKPLDEYFETLLQKYSRRGWIFEEVMRSEHRTAITSMQNFQRLGDRFTWTIPLLTSHVEKTEQPDHVIEHSCFILDPHEGPGLSTYTVSANLFQHISPRYRYVRPYCAIKWTHFLGERLHSYAKLNLLAQGCQAQ